MTSQCFHDGWKKKRVKYHLSLTCDTQTLFLSNLRILLFAKCPEKVGSAAIIMVIEKSTRATWSKGSHQCCHCMLERDANAVCFRQTTSATGHWHGCTEAVAWMRVHATSKTYSWPLLSRCQRGKNIALVDKMAVVCSPLPAGHVPRDSLDVTSTQPYHSNTQLHVWFSSVFTREGINSPPVSAA